MKDDNFVEILQISDIICLNFCKYFSTVTRVLYVLFKAGKA